MPIKTHIVKVEKGNKIEIPKTICDALGISDSIPLKVKSDNSGYRFYVEVIPTYEGAKKVQELREQIEILQEENKRLKKEINN